MIKQFCSAHPCNNLVTSPDRYCPQHTRKKDTDDIEKTRRPANIQDQKMTDPFYGTARWQKFRDWYRKGNPFCEICGSVGQMVDHIKELKDDGAPLDPDNCQTLCNTCHQRKTATERVKRGGTKPRKLRVYSYDD